MESFGLLRPLDMIQQPSQTLQGRQAEALFRQGGKASGVNRLCQLDQDRRRMVQRGTAPMVGDEKEKSRTDLENESVGRETTIDRTRRLFYVTCSRAEESLAVVYYAADPAFARDAISRQNWFRPDEIELVES